MSWLTRSDSTKKFAKQLIRNCQSLASERVKRSPIAPEEYICLRDFALLLVLRCYSMTRLLEKDGEIKRTQFSSVFFEHINFFIYYLNQMACTIMGVEAGAKLTGKVIDFVFTLSIMTLLPNLEGGEKHKFFQGCMANLNLRILDYSKYHHLILTPDEGAIKNLENSAVWEFSKKIQEFTKDQSDFIGVVAYQAETMQAMMDIDVKSFIEKMK